MNSVVNELLSLEKGKSYVVKVFIGDSMWEEIISGLKMASEQAGCTITILPVEDIRNIEFMESELLKPTNE